jgi:uncharacterized RDD family membrane protein YckC
MLSDDRIGVITPEAVEFTFDLSGLASRVLALLVDLIIQVVIFIILLIIAARYITLGPDESEFPLALVIIFAGFYIINWGYFVFFELLWNGRSPGKRLMGCRVIRDGGLPVNFISSLIRNFIRPIDYVLSALMVGFFIVFASPTYKRLGDLAAGTIVITERRMTLMSLLTERRVGGFRPTRPPLGLFTKADVTVLTKAQLHTIRRFLDRRFDLHADKRLQFARELFDKVAALMPSAKGHGIPYEQVLEEIIIATEEEKPGAAGDTG